MGVATGHALGRNQKFFAKAETTFGTFIKPSATEAMKVLKSEFKFDQKRSDRMDARSSRSVLERITGRKEVSWSVEMYALPSGAAGTAPDSNALWKALLGVETVNASTSVVYTGSATQTAMGSVTLLRHLNDVVQESIIGATVESATIKLSGGSEPRVTFEGFGADHVHTGASTLGAQASSGASSITLTAATIGNIGVGSIIQVGSDTNSSAGYEVTTVNTSTYVCGISPVMGSTVSNGSTVLPFAPSETTAGSPISGTLGSLTVDATALLITEAEITIKNNHKPVNDEAFTALVTDYIPGFREVTGKVTVRGRRDFFIHLGNRKLFTTKDLQLICGTTAGSKLKIDLDFAEFEFSPVDIPESEEAMFEIPFKALGSSGEDEITVTWF
jgi:hypothetical protein